MKIVLRLTFLTALLAAGALAQGLPDDVRAAVKSLQQGDLTQPRAAAYTLEQFTPRAAGHEAQRKDLAALLAQALADPQTAPVAKTVFCQRLALVGGDAEVPLLARLLEDPATADSARYALEGIRTEASDRALRAALDRLSGPGLIGVINALGSRRDTASVASLVKLLKASDPAVAAAAAHALAGIASKEAAAALTGTDFIEDRLLCAQALLENGAASPSREIAALVGTEGATGKTPAARIAALSVLAQTRSAEAVDQLIQALKDPEPAVPASAARFLGGVPGAEVTKRLTDLLAKADPAQQVILLEVLYHRRDTSAREPVERLLNDTNALTQWAAIQALASLGNGATARKLAALASEEGDAMRKAVEDTLAAMPDAGVDDVVREGIAGGEPATRAVMIRAAAARQCTNLNPVLLAAAADTNLPVATTAIRALGLAGTAEMYPRIVDLLASARSDAAREAAASALRSLRPRVSDPAARVAPLRAALARSDLPPETTVSLLALLAGLGGPEALAAVREQTAAGDQAIRESAVRALANWPDSAAVPDLLSLVQSTTNPTHRALALRGAFRLAPSAGQPAEQITRLKALVRSADEKRLLLSTLAGLPSLASLDEAVALLADQEVAAEAALAVVSIGRTLAAAQPQRVSDALARVLAVQATGPAADDARALVAVAKGKGEAEAARLRARENALAGTLAAGDRVVGYLDCGTTPESRTSGVGIAVVGGHTYKWAEGRDAAEAAAATVAYDHPTLHLRLDGLQAGKAYELHFTWWDYDAKGRRESVWIGDKRVVDPVALPDWQGKQQGPARLHCAVPTAALREGRIDLTFRAEGNDNALVSELWLVEKAGPPAASSAASATPSAAPPAAPGTRALIVTGMEYPGHKWRETAPFLRELIAEDSRIAVTIQEDAKAALESSSLGSNDVIVLNYMNWENPGPGAAAQENLRQAVENGTGLVLVHFACGAFQSWPEFVKMSGRIWNPKFRGHDPRGPFQVNIVDPAHEITKGFSAFGTDDELYTCLDGTTPIHILADANSKVDHKDYPMAFVLQYGKGRVFLCTLGHDVKALGFPDVKNLYRRATAWAAGLPPEK